MSESGENKRDERIENLRWQLESWIRNGNDATETFLKDCEKHGVCYAVSWVSDKAVMIHMGDWASGILGAAAGEGVDLLEAAEQYRDRLVDSLLRNEWAANSTSRYHNANEASKAEAASRMVRELELYIR